MVCGARQSGQVWVRPAQSPKELGDSGVYFGPKSQLKHKAWSLFFFFFRRLFNREIRGYHKTFIALIFLFGRVQKS